MLFTPAYFFTLLLGIGVLSLIGCIALGIFCYRLIVDRGRLLLRLERLGAQPPWAHASGLQEGAYLSDVALALASPDPYGATGATVAISDLITSQDQTQLLMFLDSDCLYSRALARELSTSMPTTDQPGIIAVIGGDPPGTPDFPHFPGTLLLDPHRQAAPIYGVTFTPAGYLVAPTRHTASPLWVGPVALLQAAQGNVTSGPPGSPRPVTPIPPDAERRRSPLITGNHAPEVHLSTIEGEPWSFGDHPGMPLTLLFIDPDCPPCHEALSLVAACPGADLTIISRGALDDPLNAMAAGLPGVTLLMQRQRETARAFHILEVPLIYALNADGQIGAGPIVGLQQIARYLAESVCRPGLAGTSAP